MTADDLVARLAREGVVASTREALPGTEWSNGPGDRYGEHEHSYDKVLVVTSGSIEFRVPGQQAALALRAGDRLDLPAGTRHGALVGPHGVRCVEVHVLRGRVRALDVRSGWLTPETGRRPGA